MYPQTHLYFAERVLGKQNDLIALGCILPDMIIGANIGHYEAHCLGISIYGFLSQTKAPRDLIRAVSTHGFEPRGLDFYGDEKYLDFERGYCFEKARSITGRTVEACNIPMELGWWKAHNVVEMGVETIISPRDNYHERLMAALCNKGLIKDVDDLLCLICGNGSVDFIGRAERFSGFVEQERATAKTLAEKFSRQMKIRHNVDIDSGKTAILIDDAAELVSSDLSDFFDATVKLVRGNIEAIGGL